MDGEDFFEGVNAVLVEKGKVEPKWQHKLMS